MKAICFADCVNWDKDNIEELEEIIDNATSIESEEFFDNCEVDEKIDKMIDDFPSDFEYYKSENRKDETIYYFVWSAVEHLYKR